MADKKAVATTAAVPEEELEDSSSDEVEQPVTKKRKRNSDKLGSSSGKEDAEKGVPKKIRKASLKKKDLELELAECKKRRETDYQSQATILNHVATLTAQNSNLSVEYQRISSENSRLNGFIENQNKFVEELKEELAFYKKKYNESHPLTKQEKQ